MAYKSGVRGASRVRSRPRQVLTKPWRVALEILRCFAALVDADVAVLEENCNAVRAADGLKKDLLPSARTHHQ